MCNYSMFTHYASVRTTHLICSAKGHVHSRAMFDDGIHRMIDAFARFVADQLHLQDAQLLFSQDVQQPVVDLEGRSPRLICNSLGLLGRERIKEWLNDSPYRSDWLFM